MGFQNYLEQSIDGRISDVDTCFIATVQSFDAEKKLADIVPSVKDHTGEDYPVLKGVPCSWQQFGRTSIAPNYKANDSVLCVVTNANLDTQLVGRKPKMKVDYNNLSNVIVVTGIKTTQEYPAEYANQSDFYLTDGLNSTIKVGAVGEGESAVETIAVDGDSVELGSGETSSVVVNSEGVAVDGTAIKIGSESLEPAVKGTQNNAKLNEIITEFNNLKKLIKGVKVTLVVAGAATGTLQLDYKNANGVPVLGTPGPFVTLSTIIDNTEVTAADSSNNSSKVQVE